MPWPGAPAHPGGVPAAGDDGQAVRIQRRWFRLQLEALGHRWAPAAYPLETGEEIPVLGEAEGVGGRLLALGAYAPDADGDDPPLPAAQAGPGLLVRAVVLADRGEGRSAGPGGVPDRGEHRPDGRRAGRGRRAGAGGVQFGEEYAAHAAGMARRILDETGLLDLERLCELFPRLGFVDELAERMRFLHWDLAFADIFYGTGPDGEPSTGFDLVLGNPPWIKLSWDEAGVIGDFEPTVVVRRRRAAALRRERPGLLARSPGLRAAYLDEYAATEATKAYLGAPQNYTLLQGMQANSYKCFLPQAWSVLGEGGVAGLLHPEGVFDDPRGGALRAAIYARLRAHFQFRNARKLFADVHDSTRFSVNVYGPARGRPGFVHMANLFAAETIEASLEHPGTGPVPGIKRVGGAGRRTATQGGWCGSARGSWRRSPRRWTPRGRPPGGPGCRRCTRRS